MTVNYGHVDVRVLQTPRRLQATETATHDHHPAARHHWTVTVIRYLPSPSQAMALRCAQASGSPRVESLAASPEADAADAARQDS